MKRPFLDTSILIGGSIALNGKASAIITENKKHFALFENKNLPVMTAAEFLEASDAA